MIKEQKYILNFGGVGMLSVREKCFLLHRQTRLMETEV